MMQKLAMLPKAIFTAPFTMLGGLVLVLVLGLTSQAEAAGLTFAKATAADKKAIATQKVCKVSGESLGSMGGPIKATRGDRSVFLCCASCEKTVLADPDKFLGAEITTSKATPADQKAIAAQKACPVSGEALGSMGGPIKVTRGGKSVFLCCPNCLKPVLAAPDKFLGAPAAASASK
jgi:cytochrome c551/c552